MRVTNKGARSFFLWTFLAFVVMLCVIGYSMAEAFNLSPYTFKLRSRATAADSLYIKGDTLYMNQMTVSLAAVMKAVAVQTDTVRGSSPTVGIVDDTLIVDTDSTGSAVTIRFGRWGGGLRWNRATDAMQFTNDFVTWTDIGTGGSSTTNADSLDGAVAHVRPLTDGYYLRYAATGDSLYLAAVTGSTDEDSIFVAYKSSRWLPLPDSGGQYIGATTDSTMLWYNLTDDNIISYVKVFYNEDVTDSALVTWGSMMAQIAATGSGDITGVITSDWIQGGASSGDVSLSIDPNILAALYLTTDTTVLQGNTVKIRSDDYLTAIELESDTVTVQNLNAGAILFNVFGTPADINEFVIKENQVTFGTGITINGLTSKIEEAMLKAVNSAVDEDILTYESTTGDFEWHTPSELGLLTSETGDISNVGVTAPITGGGSSGSVTIAFDWTWLWAFNDTMTAIVPRATLADSATGALRASLLIAPQGSANTAGRLTADSIIVDTLFATRTNTTNLKVGSDAFITDITGDGLAISGSALTATLGTAITTGEVTDGTLLWADMDSVAGVKDYVRKIFADSAAATLANARTIGGNWVNTANPWADNEVADNITAGYADSTGKTTHGSIDKWDLATSSVDSTKIVDASVSTADLRDTLITTAKLKNYSITAAKVDSSITLIITNLRTRARNNGLIQSNNFAATDAESTLKIGSAAGLTIGSSITLGTDITDDSLVQEFWPEYAGMTLFRGFSTTDIAYNDSIVIRGDADSANGNFLLFNDSTLTAGNHRRHVTIAIPVPDRVDSLRRVTVQVMSKDSSATIEYWMRGALFSRPPAYSLVDSAVGGSVLDRDSACATVVRTLHLNPSSGNWAVTPFTTRYLLLSGRRDAGNAWNWGKAYKITAVWSRTRL